ncbi:MAG: CaiB/BaiF CoA-transferase family protein [Chloroflexota bacterium]
MQALEGVKVLDLSRMIGPFCTMFLSDMGADVIKVEEPTVKWRSDEPGREGETRAYRSVDRNKKSIALNLKDPEAQKVFLKLAETADVVVEDFRPGVTKRLGIDYEKLCKVNPRIIYCAISGYGQDGPYRLLAGHNTNYIAMAGVLGISCCPDGHPTPPGVPIGDYGGGSMQGVIGILMAIIAREKTGRGQFVDVSMLDGVIAWLGARHGPQYFATGKQPAPGRLALIFETKDNKQICLSNAEPWFWERLCRLLGREELIPYYLYVRPYPEEGGEKQKEVLSALREVFLAKTRDEWFEVLSEADALVSPVYTFDEVFSDPQVLHRKMLLEFDNPPLGKVKQVGISLKLSDTPGEVKSLAPLRGQHTEEILLSLGYSKDDIGRLRESGAIN